MAQAELQRLIEVLAVYVVERGMPIKTALTILYESKHPKQAATDSEHSRTHSATHKHSNLQLAI
jgi:hypothetical protein